jgi:NAD(P)H-dependent flavin oxidoreductase YrpB (nitropropane dioxygenase family)
MQTLKPTRFTTRYGLDHPVASAGMAFASMTPELPAAVSKAGGIGSLANVGFFPPALLQQMVGGIRALTAKPFNVNFITCFVEPAIIDMAVVLKPSSVSFHWGAPKPEWVAALKAAGVDVWEQVGTVADAVRAVESGVDVVITQGSEAGGHNYGSMSTLALVPAVRHALPHAILLAAGGIVDGAGLAAALCLGADGAWVGTRFLATHESQAHPEWKRRLVAAEGFDTTRTHVFGRHHADFNPMRVLRNRVVREWDARVADIPSDNSGEIEIGRMDVWSEPTVLRKFQNLAPMASAAGDFEELPLLCGEGVSGVRDIASAADVLHRMVNEAAEVLAALVPINFNHKDSK